MKTCPETGSAYPRESYKHWVGVTADDIPPGWIDDMAKRLLEVLNRELIRLEADQRGQSDKKGPDGKPEPLELEKTAQKQRLVTEMRRNLERLSDLEMKRLPSRKQSRRKKAAISNDDSLRELERRIAQLAAATGTAKDSSGS